MLGYASGKIELDCAAMSAQTLNVARSPIATKPRTMCGVLLSSSRGVSNYEFEFVASRGLFMGPVVISFLLVAQHLLDEIHGIVPSRSYR